jgi:hypothetical protein
MKAFGSESKPLLIREIIEEGNEDKMFALLSWIKGSTFSDYSFFEVELRSIKNRYIKVDVDGWNLFNDLMMARMAMIGFICPFVGDRKYKDEGTR